VHQSREYLDIMGLAWPGGDDSFVPHLAVPDDAVAQGAALLGGAECRWAGLMPGAARGPSKRWPPRCFIEVGRRLAESCGCRAVVLGTAGETGMCAEVAQGIGGKALSVAGRTSLQVLAAVLKTCRVVVANDSGGMHLAAAVGTPVTAVFGATDPATTGPMGEGHRVIAPVGVKRSRDVRRRSSVARAGLETIGPDEVYRAAAELASAVAC
jgi:heptosyltransferase-2